MTIRLRISSRTFTGCSLYPTLLSQEREEMFKRIRLTFWWRWSRSNQCMKNCLGFHRLKYWLTNSLNVNCPMMTRHWLNNSEHDYNMSTPDIQFYLGGYVAHKLLKFTTCDQCIAKLTKPSTCLSAESKLVEIKTRGGLKLPSVSLTHHSTHQTSRVECAEILRQAENIHVSGHTWARLRDWGTGHPVDRILPDGTQSIRAVQRSHFKDCTSHLRCAAGVRPGPILFISYSAAVIAFVQHHGFKVHAFADDLQIYGSTAQSGAADLMARMSNCVESVASWMSSNRLRLNPSKTELIWLGTSRRLQHCAVLTMSVCGADVRPVGCVRDLGVLIDSNMTLLNHVNNVAGICFYQLRIIRRSLTTEATHSLVRALIHTRVDYCNGLLAAGPKYLHKKLPCVLRAGARLVLQLPHRASVSDIMRRQLHWLEMPDRIRFKLCTLVFRCLYGLAPRYLSDLCTPATVHTHLRSSVTLERSVSPPDENQDDRSTRILFRIVCCLERTSSAPARPWTLAEQFQN